jgi:hypothetical protein
LELEVNGPARGHGELRQAFNLTYHRSWTTL